MILNEMLGLLDMKNGALEEFIAENERFVGEIQSRSTSLKEFKNFYRTRENILGKISKIDKDIESLFSMSNYSFIDADFMSEDSQTKSIRQRQKKKRKLVTKIVDQDLLIMTLCSESKMKLSD